MSEIQTEAAALAVVRRNGYALYYVPGKLLTEEVCLAAGRFIYRLAYHKLHAA